MRTILCCAGIAALAALGWSADDTTPAKKTTSPQKTVAKSPASATKRKAVTSKTGSKTTTSHPSTTKAGSKTTASHPATTKAGSKTTASRPATTKAGSKTTASRPATTKAGSKTTASRRGKKGPPVKSVTWRNRQVAPTPQRYKEIQDALAAKGYLNPEDASGTWNQASMDALKKFQAGQNLDSTGKINSLSLIALGLGPRRETAAPKPAAEIPLPDRQ
jgi:Putative peptidoglycan binding domain